MKATNVIKNIIKLGTALVGIGSVVYLGKRKLKQEVQLQKRYRNYYELTNRWLANHNEGKNVAEYFIKKHINSIAIYGMGTLGELFYDEITKQNIDVICFIDKNAKELYYGIDDKLVVGLEEFGERERVDAIVITPVFDFEKIKSDLEKNNINTAIISLEDVICE